MIGRTVSHYRVVEKLGAPSLRSDMPGFHSRGSRSRSLSNIGAHEDELGHGDALGNTCAEATWMASRARRGCVETSVSAAANTSLLTSINAQNPRSVATRFRISGTRFRERPFGHTPPQGAPQLDGTIADVTSRSAAEAAAPRDGPPPRRTA